MKKISLTLWGMLTTIIMACNTGELSMTTVINENGSAVRTYRQKNVVSSKDKKQQTPTLLFGRNDNDYLQQKRQGDTIISTAQKEVERVDDLGKYTRLILGTNRQLSPQTQVEKHFRWFFTRYVYRETYPGINFKFAIAANKFLTNDELSYWLTGYPQLDEGLSGSEKEELLAQIKEKYTQWLTANLFEEQFRILVNNYDKVQNAPMSRQEFIRQKSRWYRHFLSMETKNTLSDGLAEVLAKELNTAAYTSVLGNEILMKEVLDKQEWFMTLINFRVNYKLSVPGKILEVQNALVQTVDGKNQEVVTRITGEKLLHGAYRIEVSSMVIHPWAIGITILVALLILIAVVRKSFRKSVF